MSGDEISKIVKEFAKKIAEVKDAFIIEELKPYCDTEVYDDDYKIVWKQKVRLRLTEYKDWRRQFEQEKEMLQQRLIDDVRRLQKDSIGFYEQSTIWSDILYIINKHFGVKNEY